MKTIYNLQKGDSYWRPSPVIDLDKMSGKFEPRKIEIINEIDLLKYKTDLKYGKVSLTKKDCQKSIDYDAAITKINKRASELEHVSNLKGATLIYLEDGKLNLSADPYKCGKITFKNNKIAKSIIEELPNEVKTVLGVS